MDGKPQHQRRCVCHPVPAKGSGGPARGTSVAVFMARAAAPRSTQRRYCRHWWPPGSPSSVTSSTLPGICGRSGRLTGSALVSMALRWASMRCSYHHRAFLYTRTPYISMYKYPALIDIATGFMGALGPDQGGYKSSRELQSYHVPGRNLQAGTSSEAAGTFGRLGLVFLRSVCAYGIGPTTPYTSTSCIAALMREIITGVFDGESLSAGVLLITNLGIGVSARVFIKV